MLGGYELNDICDEEMTWDEEVKNAAIDNILATIIVAAKAYEDTVLGACQTRI